MDKLIDHKEGILKKEASEEELQTYFICREFFKLLSEYKQNNERIFALTGDYGLAIHLKEEMFRPIFGHFDVYNLCSTWKMQKEYHDLTFVACQNTIYRYQKELGLTAKLLPGVVIIDSGVAQIMRRQLQGWAYLQV